MPAQLQAVSVTRLFLAVSLIKINQRPRTAINPEDFTMYQVVLEAEDGCYTLTDPMTETSAIRWINNNKDRYGEGQRLYLEYVEY